MKNRVKAFTFFASLVVSFTSAQVVSIDNMQDFTIQNKVNESNVVFAGGKKINIDEVKGSPYWRDDFTLGQIRDTKKDKNLSAFIRYRIIDDMFEIKKAKDASEIMNLKRSEDYKIKIGNKKFVFYQNLPKSFNGSNNGYLLELFNSEDAKLYKRFSQKYTPARERSSAYGSENKATLDSKENYFIKIDGNLYHVEPHKRKAADAFPDKNKELEKYIKKQKLKFRNKDEESDLIKLVTYYDTL